ncbi:CTP_transf_like domain-containing protein [Haematococcus lacustris]|uniref:CTP_transf_like domain-containing protein n=2 Tax=Haematococcus lacustris TaxID=44745 RepID=A0A699YCL5_HAELA|nr:CTP_transf_like domain-containing protein [Haematococcus lacustris]
MLLCGADVLASMAQPGAWHLPEELLQEHGVVCVERRHGTGALQQAGGLQTLLEQPGSLLNEADGLVHNAGSNTVSSFSQLEMALATALMATAVSGA